MNNKKYKATIGIVVGLTALAGGLFAYENLYVAKQEQANLVPVYVAKNNIPASTVIEEEMFKVVEIHKNSVLSSYVTDIDSVEGQQTVGAIFKAEPLMKQRLSDSLEVSQGDFELKIVPDFVGNLKVGDKVKVYVQLTNSKTRETSMQVLFDQKRVNKLTTLDNTMVDNALGVAYQIESFTVNVNEEELQDYYNAKQVGDVIVARYDIVDVDVEMEKEDVPPPPGQEPVADIEESVADMDNTGEVKPFDSTSEEVLQATKKDADNGEAIAVMSYVVQEGETIDTLSIKFKTSVEALSMMNEQKTTFGAGETITVPAE